jgi:2-polyprenyl-3-methyl-5-hydroxy-6-metoxy-1,4-benzoquinol methylase
METMISNILSPWDKDYEGTQFSPVYEPLWHMLQMFLQSVPVKSVLDFGCGDGNYSFHMKEEGLQVTGIDISTRAIEKAITHTNSCKGEKIEFIRHDSIPDDFPNDSFDVVLMLNSLHCLTCKERSNILIQVKRVLKKNGYLFASVLSLKDESYPRQEWKEIERNTFDDWTGKKFHFYSFDELEDELKGLRILEKRVLQNIHPEVGRRSVLFVVTAKNAG